jgi:hypothetical protein
LTEIVPLYPLMPNDYPGTGPMWVEMCREVEASMRMFLEQYKVSWVASEQRSSNQAYCFAGQPDLKCHLNWKGRTRMAVVDYKRVAAVTISHRLQVQAYRMLSGYADCAKGFILWLKKGGGYELIEVKHDPHDRAAIIAAAVLLNWKIANGKLDAKNVW